MRAILDNPRYTGYAVLGRYSKHETLLDPDDVAAGNVVRFRKSAKDTVVRSRRPAHPAIVSVATFTQAQLLRRSRASGGLSAARKLERGVKDTKHVYLFRGRVRCSICQRRLLDQIPKATIINRADVEALVDHLGGLSSALAGAQPEHLEAFYRDFGLSMVYDPYANAVDVTIRPPLVGVVRVSEGDLHTNHTPRA